MIVTTVIIMKDEANKVLQHSTRCLISAYRETGK